MKKFLIRISFSLFILQSSGYSSNIDEYWKWDEANKVLSSKAQSNTTDSEVEKILNAVRILASTSELHDSLKKALRHYNADYMAQSILQFTYMNGGKYTVVLEDDFLSRTKATNINMQGMFMVTKIGNNFLSHTTSLETLTFPSKMNRLESIGERFLAHATSLKTLIFPSELNQLKSIGNSFLGQATSLKTLKFPSKLNQLKSIGDYFLAQASSLKTLTLPSKLNQLESIEDVFLYGARSLKTLTLPSELNQLESIGNSFLDQVLSLKIIKCPKNALSLIKNTQIYPQTLIPALSRKLPL